MSNQELQSGVIQATYALSKTQIMHVSHMWSGTQLSFYFSCSPSYSTVELSMHQLISRAAHCSCTLWPDGPIVLQEDMQWGWQVRMMLGVAHSVTALLDILSRLLKYYNDCMYHVNMYCNICDLLCLWSLNAYKTCIYSNIWLLRLDARDTDQISDLCSWSGWHMSQQVQLLYLCCDKISSGTWSAK